MASTHRCDVAIVGAGLAGGLIALALAERRPEASLCLIEAGDTLGGNHVWSFFDSDVAPADRWLVDRLVCHHWPAYDVAFRSHARTLARGYNAIESERFDAVVRAALPPGTVLKGRVVAIEAGAATLDGGDRVEAGALIDTRGAGDVGRLDAGWQKFVGQLLHLDAPHGLTRPIVMDATVEQIDGYRFVYVLPFDATSVFVEDTYYSEDPALDVEAVGRRIADYAAARGWRATPSNRIETGILPVVVAGDFEAYWASGGTGVAKAGMRAGLFHPLTGYSLPDAVRTAAAIAAAPALDGESLHALTRDLARRAWAGRGFYRLLSRLLFHAGDPAERHRVFARFYRLSPSLIERFYAGHSTMTDKARLLIGKPPVPFVPALGVLAAHTRAEAR